MIHPRRVNLERWWRCEPSDTPEGDEREDEWEKDLTEEGIEPNPGPVRIISKNVNSVSSPELFDKLLKNAKQIHENKKVTAFLIQDHSITADRHDWAVSQARRSNMMWIAS